MSSEKELLEVKEWLDHREAVLESRMKVFEKREKWLKKQEAVLKAREIRIKDVESSFKSGGGARGVGEIILKQDTKYLFRITNTIAQAKWASQQFTWYEHTDAA